MGFDVALGYLPNPVGCLTLSQTSPFLCVCSTSLFESTVGNREITCNKQFFLFPHCFLTRSDNYLPFSSNCCLQTLSVWKSKICCLGKGLRDKLLTNAIGCDTMSTRLLYVYCWVEVTDWL